MSYPANGGLMLNGRSLCDVFMDKLPARSVQKPPTDGPVASSTRSSGEPHAIHYGFGDIHKPGA
jgi:hypothetical protein